MQAAAEARRRKKRGDDATAQEDQDGAAAGGGDASLRGGGSVKAGDATKRPRKASFGLPEGAPGDAHVVVTAGGQSGGDPWVSVHR